MAEINFNAHDFSIKAKTPISIVGGMSFDTFNLLSKTAQVKHIQSLINDIPMNQPFSCKLLSNLIKAKHYFLKNSDIQSPIIFRKGTPDHVQRGYKFQGFFCHIDKWHPVSWRKSIAGDLSFEQMFKNQARDYIQPLMQKYKSRHHECELCGKDTVLDVDHVDPEFNDIALTAIDLITDYDKNLFTSLFDFFDESRCWIPEYHPSIQYVINRHRTATLQAVCHGCHKLAAKKRREARRVSV